MGEKLHLLALSQKNVDYALKEWKHRQALVKVGEHAPVNEVLIELKQLLSLPAVPSHIECFDNSNFQGAYPVSAMVCFKNGIASKSDYRKFNIKTVVGINDFASMHETVLRRYSSVLQKKQPLPQLIIIDGGKGQLNAALDALKELGIQDKVTTVGLAKNIEELFFPGDSRSILLNWNSAAHNLIRNIRDEVHRFGITFHRAQRSKGALQNSLDHIEGIGPKTKETLLTYFKSVSKIKTANHNILTELIGPAKTKILIAAFEKDIKKMLQQAEVKSFSYRDVKGFKDHSEEGVETNWFGTEMNETDSLLFYAFVKKDNVDLLFDLVTGFNEKQETESKIHLAVVNIEKSN